jgi:hypothetical protein
MRKTRFMSLFFLVLAIAFFLLPEFREGLRMSPLSIAPSNFEQALLRRGALDTAMLERAARTAEQQRDARTLAFVALHAGDAQERVRCADQAVAIDPKLTWVYYSLVLQHRKEPVAQKWLAQLQAWDPDNAMPYLHQAASLFEERNLPYTSLPKALEQLAQQADWRQLMEKAFAAPRYDTYMQRRFDLERAWLTERGEARPIAVVLSVAAYPIPNLLNIRTYANLLVNKLGKEAEAAGRTDEALRYYWTAAHFGERMQLQGATLIEKLIATVLQKMAYEKLAPLLRKAGRADEALTVEYANSGLQQFRETMGGKDPLAQSVNYGWAALLFHISGGLVVVFGVLTVLCLVYVNAKRWVRPEKKGRLYRFFTTAENYVPILFFLACVGFNVACYPYWRNLQHYMTASGGTHNFEPLFYNTLPFPVLPGQAQLPLGNPFVPYVWYALAGIAVVALVEILIRRRSAAS